MAKDGSIAGYFFALLTVIGAIPLLFLCIRYYRQKKIKDRIENQLENHAIDYMIECRQHVIEQNLEEQKKSIKYQSQRLLSNISTSSLLTGFNQDHFEYLLRQQHTFWGINDFILKEGKVKFGDMQLLQLPSGLYEDFLYYVINNINPIAFLFSSEKHPQPMLSRFVSYTTAQTFILLIYLLIPSGTIRLILNYLFSPLILLVEHWLNLMLVCPCLPEIPTESNPRPGDEDGTNTTTEDSKAPHLAQKAAYHTIRMIGWFLAFPILFSLIVILISISILLSNETIEPNLLGMFVLDGIIIPFLIKLAIALVNYLWFLHPTHVRVCGITALRINSWTETQTQEYLMYQSSQWAEDKRNSDLESRKKANYSEVDIFHCACYCIQWRGHPLDSHYDLDVCQPSCFITRCCDGISAWYWEEDQEVEKLLPSPVRHSMSRNSTPITPPEPTIRHDDDEVEE